MGHEPELRQPPEPKATRRRRSARRGQARRRVLVFMPFGDAALNEFYDYVIKPFLESLGLDCVRLDQEGGAPQIDQAVKVQLRTADIVLVDLTGNRPSVNCELGLALGRDKPLVLMAQLQQRLDELAIYVKGCRILQYELSFKGADELKRQLEVNIRDILKNIRKS